MTLNDPWSDLNSDTAIVFSIADLRDLPAASNNAEKVLMSNIVWLAIVYSMLNLNVLSNFHVFLLNRKNLA